MLNPIVEVSVHRYDTDVSPIKWNLNGCIKFELVAADHAHPNAVKITGPGFTEILPFSDFVKAAEWLKRCEP